MSTVQTTPGNITHSTEGEHRIPTEQRRASMVGPLVESHCRTDKPMRRVLKHNAAAGNKEAPALRRVQAGRSKLPCANVVDRATAMRRREAPRTEHRVETA